MVWWKRNIIIFPNKIKMIKSKFSFRKKKNARESPRIDTLIELEHSHVVVSYVLELKIRLLKNLFAITSRSTLTVFIGHKESDLSGLHLLRLGSFPMITILTDS